MGPKELKTEGAPATSNGRIRRGLRFEPSLEGARGLWAGRGCGGEGGIAPVLLSYLCRVGRPGTANWGISAGFAARAAIEAGVGVPWVAVCPRQEVRASHEV